MRHGKVLALRIPTENEMAEINRSALVRFSAKQMFDLVNDVSAYPDFIPGCAASEVHDASDGHMQASLQVAKGGIQKWFTTHNTLSSPHLIEMKLVDGPFRYLKGYWEFNSLAEDACKVNLKLDFEFSSGVLDAAFSKIFQQLVAGMVNAFVMRAKEVYCV